MIGRSQKDANVFIEVIVKERPVHDAMVDFAWRIFLFSSLISLITAALVYFSLQWFMVRPMRRLTDNIVGFREDAEDASRAWHPSKRPDEIGVAERVLAASELQIAQKRQGADVGNPCAACSFRKMSIRAELDSSELSRMAAIARTQSFAGRQTIVDEGEPAACMFNTSSGAVKLYKLLPDGRRQITVFFEADFWEAL
ncbi:MAG: cyclic nucleotide-binding domain-containing protein [Alphaproteobacteria bacterium]|nr:cyclic nucleotide-binding domain-containing protein [Alphaproteobacteria bacterium]